MELALYAPEIGYYRRQRHPVGAAGDFFTAEQLAPFAELIATFVESAAHEAEADAESGACWRVLELGAGRRELSNALTRWDYQGFDWDSECLPDPRPGVIFANEFFDALPVHLVRRKSPNAQWRSVDVAPMNGRLSLVDVAVAEDGIAEYLRRYDHSLRDSVATEVSLAGAHWVKRAAGLLTRGFFLVIDYGYDASELPRFPNGSLMSYRRHVASNDLLATPGERDLTAHVNFTELIRVGREHGLALRFNGSLQSWALSLWSGHELETRLDARDAKWRRDWKQLVFGMGETFRVLIFEKAGNGSGK